MFESGFHRMLSQGKFSKSTSGGAAAKRRIAEVQNA